MIENENLVTIAEVCKSIGMHKVTLAYRLRSAKIFPVGKRKLRSLYKKNEIYEIAQKNIKMGPKNGENVSAKKTNKNRCYRCNQSDYLNGVRGGLCFDCWCHDYCIEHKL
jgi:hypothetical protein